MTKIVREEIYRSLRNGGMLISLVIGCAIALVQVIHCQIPAYQMNQTIDFEKFPILFLYTVSDTWIGGSPVYMETFLYFLVLPILAALPFGTSYFTDNKSGFLKGIYMRCSRRQYLTAKYIAGFLSGGIAVTIPILLNLACAVCLLPNLPAQSVLPHNGIDATNLFYSVYFSKPLLYILIFLCIDFILGGIWACFALAASFVSDYRIIIMLAPFFIQLTIHVICTMLNQTSYSSVYFAQSGYGVLQTGACIFHIIIGCGLTWFVFRRKGEKEDVF